MKKLVWTVILLSLVVIIWKFAIPSADRYTSTVEYCNSCHVHHFSDASFHKSVHGDSLAGVSCVDCHLPPKGEGYFLEKMKMGSRDIYAILFKDSSEYSWNKRNDQLYYHDFTWNNSCLKCHSKLFPEDLSKRGELAHLKFRMNEDKIRCVDCHLKVGHFEEIIKTDFDKIAKQFVEFSVDTFRSYNEKIPGTGITFDMIAIQGGLNELKYPTREIQIQLSDFYIGSCEVSWDEYNAFYYETRSEGRLESDSNKPIDAVSGPTPPWGAVDQGWGTGKMPAITMTHYAATKYCEWLSLKTGRKYRLPTEAEWNYVSQLGQIEDSNPNVNSERPVKANLGIANKSGVYHLYGNVSEFCQDSYVDFPFDSIAEEIIVNPVFTNHSDSFVVKGASFIHSKDEVSSDFRYRTDRQQWQKTDPQMPKSIWWYSDCNYIGFRVVCEP